MAWLLEHRPDIFAGARPTMPHFLVPWLVPTMHCPSSVMMIVVGSASRPLKKWMTLADG